MIQKFYEFINEKVNMDDVGADIQKMLDKKPTVKMTSDNYPSEKGIYSLAGIKKYLSDKYTTLQVDGGMYNLNQAKIKLDSIGVDVYYTTSKKSRVPFYYSGLDKKQAENYKKEFEEKNAELSSVIIKKGQEKKATVKDVNNVSTAKAKKERKTPKTTTRKPRTKK